MSAPWVCDPDHTVHAGYCELISRKAITYAVKIVGYPQMRQHLERPDAAQRHEGPARVKPCPICIPADS